MMDNRFGRASRPHETGSSEPNRAELPIDEENGGIPSLSGNPSGVLKPGSLVKVREDDLARLVIAARRMSFEADDKATLADVLDQLDKASEAFADTFPWSDEPEEDCGPLNTGDAVELGSHGGRDVVGIVCEDGSVLVHKADGAGAVVVSRENIRALALLERRIP